MGWIDYFNSISHSVLYILSKWNCNQFVSDIGQRVTQLCGHDQDIMSKRGANTWIVVRN